MKVTLYEFCLLHHQEELLEQWDPANLPATPQNVTYGTRDEYWWQCEKRFLGKLSFIRYLWLCAFFL